MTPKQFSKWAYKLPHVQHEAGGWKYYWLEDLEHFREFIEAPTPIDTKPPSKRKRQSNKDYWGLNS